MKLTEFIKRYDELVERAIEIVGEAGLGVPDDDDEGTVRLDVVDDATARIRWVHFENYDCGGTLSQLESEPFPIGLLFAPQAEADEWCIATRRARDEERMRRDTATRTMYALQEREREIRELARLKAKYGG